MQKSCYCVYPFTGREGDAASFDRYWTCGNGEGAQQKRANWSFDYIKGVNGKNNGRHYDDQIAQLNPIQYGLFLNSC